MGQFEKLLNWGLLIGGFIGIVFPAFLDPPKSLTQILVGTLKPELTLSYAMEVLFLVMFLCGAYILSIRRIFRDIPITVMSTRINIEFGDKGKKAAFHREQILRANHNDVTAYHSAVQPTSPGGKIIEKQINMSVYCENCNFTNEVDSVGTEQTGFEFIHEFGQSLPYKWYMPLIPLSLIPPESRSNFKAIKNNLVIRTQDMVYEDEFNVEKPMVQITSGRYSARNTEIVLRFHGLDKPKEVKCRMIKSNGVVSGHLKKNR
jgi:hypothetical protein